MKKFNSAIARVRNSAGEFEALPALRGLDSYQLAVQNGFEGTEEEWMNSIIGDGWVGAFQTLEAQQGEFEEKQAAFEANQTAFEEKQTTLENKQTELEKDFDDITPESIRAAALDDNGKIVADQASSCVIIITESTTLALAHTGKVIQADSTDDITITIPANDSVAFPNETEIEVVRWNTGAVNFAAADGVTIVSLDGAKSIDGQYGCAVLKNMTANTWLLSGALG